jgi:hypothetical protein
MARAAQPRELAAPPIPVDPRVSAVQPVPAVPRRWAARWARAARTARVGPPGRGPPPDLATLIRQHAVCRGAQYSSRALRVAQREALAVKRASDTTTQDISVLAPGGYADAATQDTFCVNTKCGIPIVHDQSPQHNDVPVSGKTHSMPDGGNPHPNHPSTQGSGTEGYSPPQIETGCRVGQCVCVGPVPRSAWKLA